MFEVTKQLTTFIKKTDKIYLIPIVLLLIIVALVIVYAAISPVPIFLYPLI